MNHSYIRCAAYECKNRTHSETRSGRQHIYLISCYIYIYCIKIVLVRFGLGGLNHTGLQHWYCLKGISYIFSEKIYKSIAGSPRYNCQKCCSVLGNIAGTVISITLCSYYLAIVNLNLPLHTKLELLQNFFAVRFC